jgi:hypothetical protein
LKKNGNPQTNRDRAGPSSRVAVQKGRIRKRLGEISRIAVTKGCYRSLQQTSAMDPAARLLELDERCRLVLCSRDFSTRRQFADIVQEIGYLRNRYPYLTQKLEGLYSDAYPGRLVTTGSLIEFACERNLRLDGEPIRN